jgi:CRISPR/Cas system CMR-associated protein Cmr3 (group 5 of RAMP superfamily)
MFDDFISRIIREQSIYRQQVCLKSNKDLGMSLLEFSRLSKKEKKKINVLPVIQYVRYFKECLFGITGSRDFVLNVQKSILLFLKSDLHFNIEGNTISS